MDTEEVLECLCSFPGVVVWDLGGSVVSDVGLANTVKDPSTDGAHESSVNGSKGTSSKSPLLGRVMGQDGVGVLEVGDEDEPVVDVEVWDTVDDEHFGERPLDGPVSKTGNDGSDTNVGQDDLPGLAVSENVGLGVEVYTSNRVRRHGKELTVGVGGVAKLSRGVPDQVQRPSE